MDVKDLDRYYSRALTRFRPPGHDEDLRVVYRCLTPKELRQLAAMLRDPSKTVYDVLAFCVTALPDVTQEGRPVKVDAELLNSLDLLTANAMRDAVMSEIQEDLNPNRFREWLVNPASRPLRKTEFCGHVEEWR